MNGSIIICTRNRADNLARTLAAIDDLKLLSELQTEILVVDNASTDDTNLVARNTKLKNFEVRYFYEARKGKGHALNLSLSKARGEIFLFTDDDVAPAKDWLERISRPLLERQCDAVVGCIELAQELCRSWMTPQHLISVAAYHGEPVQLVGANMGFHRSVLERVPKFDVELAPGALGFGEDTLFSWQLVEAGFRLQYIPEALVIHSPEASRLLRASWLSSGRKHGASMAYLLHHWFHRKLPSPRLRYYYTALKLHLRRRLEPPRAMEEEGIAPWEMSYVGEMEKCRQYLIESKRPRNYPKRGLRKLSP